ncbi:DNA-3-methyladenine glycosylase [Flexivirga endophytica]|uniref:DNA-3-methyladenine glycosylase II n=1 Tax=Flexivirga endophytica TaxID=1849103 RepID=A0A916T1Y6_9MICO|nr:AlkA N-terminal domain-containing protein [Flexivirga endophytica]GGB27300.1 DNA-3-methyladenine glycosylase [Flexivirga endophytica]GHB55779.1 DNA-3-methyladenine glycosylase [Flexivirga endophytica]
MLTDPQTCMTAVRSRDARFDGWFVTGVRTTGIYCRPSCPATPPKARNITFYPSAAAAQASGFRACKRCRPDASPGSPEWNVRADLVARAMRLIADGVVDREGVDGLSRRLGYSTRQVERQVRAELGASPLALARAQRAQTARVLIETTNLPLTQVAHASGFGSIRSFNDTVRAVFAMAPRELRSRTKVLAGGASPTGAAWHHLQLRLPFRRPLEVGNLFGHLVATAVPGVEEWRDGAYRRTMQLPHGPAVIALRPDDGFVAARVWLRDLTDLPVAISRSRWLLDLDADPEAIDAHLATDEVLAPLVAAAPGRRVPRTVDGVEFALRLVIGQQISTRAARTHAARLVEAYGEPIDDPDGGLTATFPDAVAIATAADETLAMPQSRRNTLRALATALAEGRIDVSTSADWARTRQELLALPGIGPWTVEGVAMRALGDPDAFLATDLGVRQAMSALGLPDAGRAQLDTAAPWRPWRAYAVQHLWGSVPHEINQLPEQATHEQTRSAG